MPEEYLHLDGQNPQMTKNCIPYFFTAQNRICPIYKPRARQHDSSRKILRSKHLFLILFRQLGTLLPGESLSTDDLVQLGKARFKIALTKESEERVG